MPQATWQCFNAIVKSEGKTNHTAARFRLHTEWYHARWALLTHWKKCDNLPLIPGSVYFLYWFLGSGGQTGRRSHNRRKCQIVWWHYCRNVGCLHAPSGEALRGIVQWWHNGLRVVLNVFWTQFVWPQYKISIHFYRCKSSIFKKAWLMVYELLLLFSRNPAGLPLTNCSAMQLVWNESVLTTECQNTF